MTGAEVAGAVVVAGMQAVLAFTCGVVSEKARAQAGKDEVGRALGRAIGEQSELIRAENAQRRGRLDSGGRLLRAVGELLTLEGRAERPLRHPFGEWDEAVGELGAAYYAVPVEYRGDASEGLTVPPPSEAKGGPLLCDCGAAIAHTEGSAVCNRRAVRP